LILVPALLCASAGVVAGTFSSSIISTSDIEVLLSSSNCGFWNQTINNETPINDPNMVATNIFTAEGLEAAELYARQCYNATSLKDCNTYPSTNIGWNTDYMAPCPYDSSMCLVPAMQMDTGLMNLNTVFGINFAPKSQLLFRKITTCAPITQENYVVYKKSQTTNQTLAEYMYGPQVGFENSPYTWSINSGVSNNTLAYSLA
jgi:hypothetical protein